MIQGVEFKKLTTHADERGFFREVFRFKEEFRGVSIGQLSHSFVNEGVIKAWHGHVQQSQWNYVVVGEIEVALIDNRENSKTYRKLNNFTIGNSEDIIAYYFPPGVLHGYKCIHGPMQIIYVTSGVYDLNDEIRISPETLNEIYNWNK